MADKEKKLKEAIYDPGDTVPVRGPEAGEDHPLLAVKYAEEHNLGPNDTIIDTFTPDEKKELLKMIKKGEFTQLEAAVLHALMSEAATLEDIGAMIGAVSRRTKGAPTSKPAAIKELNRILQVVAKRSKAKFGKEADLTRIKTYNDEMKKIAKWRAKKAKEAERYANKVEREFYKELADLRRTQKAHGLKPARQVDMKDWKPGSGDVPYIKKFAPKDKDISKMKKFGGTPDDLG